MLKIKIINNNNNNEKNAKEEEGINNMSSFDFDIPEVDEKEIEQELERQQGIKNENNGAIEYAIIGSGQGGSRIAESFYNFGYKKCVIINTAEHDLKNIKIPDSQKLLMKLDLAGAGKDMAKGAEAAKKYEQEIYNLMKSVFGKCDRILVCIGSGGGTGGGTVFNILLSCKKYLKYIGVQDIDKKVGVICSIPENGECNSKKIAENALMVIEPLCDYAEEGKISPLLFVDNNKIRKLYPNLTVSQYWPTINKTIAGLFNVFNLMATKDSEYACFDSADYDKVMSAAGCLIMGATKIKDYNDKNSISISIKSNLEKTLLAEGFDLQTAKAAGSIVIVGDVLSNTVQGLYNSINYGFDTLANIIKNGEVYRGVYSDDGNKIIVYTVINGLNRPQKRIEELLTFTSDEFPGRNI